MNKIKDISGEMIAQLNEEIAICNNEGKLNIQMILDVVDFFPEIVKDMRFNCVSSYIAVVGRSHQKEDVGYYGERIVSKATQLGLNTCWILKDFNRDKCKCTINKGQRLICIIAISCEEIKVNPYDRKTQNVIYREQDDVPDWFKKGFKHASSIDNIEGNQHFLFSLSDGKVRIEPMDRIYSKIELGVTKFRFENAAGKNNFVWDNVIKRSFQYPFGVIQYTRN